MISTMKVGRAIALIALATSIATGCGGDDGDKAATTDTPASDDTPATTAATSGSTSLDEVCSKFEQGEIEALLGITLDASKARDSADGPFGKDRFCGWDPNNKVTPKTVGLSIRVGHTECGQISFGSPVVMDGVPDATYDTDTDLSHGTAPDGTCFSVGVPSDLTQDQSISLGAYVASKLT